MTVALMESDGPDDITTKVHHSLQEVGMPPETWASIFLPLLGVQEGMNQLAALSPEARKALIVTACTQFCLNGSRQRPLVLEIDDMHWIDASSEECLGVLVERMVGVPLMLLHDVSAGVSAYLDRQILYHPASLDTS